MNKILKIINNILFFINAIILFSFYNHMLDTSFIKITTCLMIVLVLFIINIIQLIKKNDILNDKKYNIMFLLVNIIVLIIFLRDIFDSTMPIRSLINFNIDSIPSTNGFFIDYNALLIIIMYVGILIYNLLNKDKNKNSD